MEWNSFVVPYLKLVYGKNSMQELGHKNTRSPFFGGKLLKPILIRWVGATFAIGSGVGMVGSGIGAGLGAIVGIIRTGLGDVGSGLSKAVRFKGRTITWHSGGSKRGGSSTPVNSV
ncbi:hypothetical protein Ancab_023573 [Ancistrocladus abbreviatus]